MSLEKMVVLHVGAGKTGSSALQSGFAGNLEALGRAGVYYPWASGVDIAAKGATTSGNGAQLAAQICGPDPVSEQSYDIDAAIDAAEAEAVTRVLISSEFLMSINPRKFRGFHEKLTRRGYGCRVVFFVRSIFGHALSCYMQEVKGHQYTATLQEYLTEKYVNRFLQVIRKFQAMDVDFQVRNYDAVKDSLFADFCATSLNIDPSGMVMPDIVNRSLSVPEIEIFRCFNQICVANAVPNSRSRPVVYDFLKIIPTFQTPKTIPSGCLRTIHDKYASDVDEINALCPDCNLVAVPDEFQGSADMRDFSDRDELIYNYIAALIYGQNFKRPG